jgi:hypothetical protein
MKPYEAAFSVGTHVRVADLQDLASFFSEWKYHNRLELHQLEFAAKAAVVSELGYYHGGDPLYVLEGVPGVWHECCLRGID